VTAPFKKIPGWTKIFRAFLISQVVFFLFLFYEQNVGARFTVVLNPPGPPSGVVVPVVHLVHLNPF